LKAMKHSDNTDIDKLCLIYKVAKQWGIGKKSPAQKKMGMC